MAKHVVVDCEGSGPCPGYGCMINFGAFVVEEPLERGFASPIIEPYCDRFDAAAYDFMGLDLEKHRAAAECTLAEAMQQFGEWLSGISKERLVFWSDNPAYDWQWINHGFAVAGIANPFGFSARRIGDLYAGTMKTPGDHNSWRKFKITPHDHDPLNDAKGNAEALLEVLRLNDDLKWLRRQNDG